MLKPKLLFLSVFIAGSAGGVIRGYMLSEVFDKTTGLPEPNHPLTWSLIGLALLVAALSFFVKLDVNAAPGSAVKPFVLLACVALGVSAFIDIVDMIDGNATLAQLALAGLGLLSAAVVMLLATSRNTHKLTLGLYATVPVFWACFWFFLVFYKNSSNPVVLEYIFEFLAALFTVAACYTFSGFFFGLVRPRVLGLFVRLGIFFTLVNLISPVAARIAAPDTSLDDGVTPTSMLRMAFALLYVAFIPGMAANAMNMPDPPEEPQKTDNDGEEPEDA